LSNRQNYLSHGHTLLGSAFYDAVVALCSLPVLTAHYTSCFKPEKSI